MFLLNSRLGHFSATPIFWGRPFSRSYGASLPSSLTKGIPFTSVFSTCPPVSVCGTVDVRSRIEAFLGGVGVRAELSWLPNSSHHPQVQRARGFPCVRSLVRLGRCCPAPAYPAASPHS